MSARLLPLARSKLPRTCVKRCGVASPTERADTLVDYLDPTKGALLIANARETLRGSQVVTPEDIQAGWRVLTPEQAETVRGALIHYPHDWRRALALLAGVPGKDSDT